MQLCATLCDVCGVGRCAGTHEQRCGAVARVWREEGDGRGGMRMRQRAAGSRYPRRACSGAEGGDGLSASRGPDRGRAALGPPRDTQMPPRGATVLVRVCPWGRAAAARRVPRAGSVRAAGTLQDAVRGGRNGGV